MSRITRKILAVEWSDASSPESGWVDATDFEDAADLSDIAPVVSVGMLVKKTRYNVVLCLDWQGDDTIGNVIIIPAPMVRRITELGTVKELCHGYKVERNCTCTKD